MKSRMKKWTAFVLAVVMATGYTAYPVQAEERTEVKAVSDVQTESSVAKVGDVYYDDLAEALNNAKGQTCEILILKDTSLNGSFEFQRPEDVVTINLDGHTISGNFTLTLGGQVGSHLNGPGTINGNIDFVQGYLGAPLTVNGNLADVGVTSLKVTGTGVLRVNGNIGDFAAGAIIYDGALIVCTGTCDDDSIEVMQPQDGDALIENSKPTNLTGTYGQQLSTVVLDNGWTWVHGDTTLSLGEHEFPARFDTTNYEGLYDFDTGYNAENHYVEVNLIVNISKKETTLRKKQHFLSQIT